MGKTKTKLDRVVFVGTKCECSECNFVGNFTQIRLHLKVTHKFTGSVGRQRSSENCYFCGLAFPNREKVQKHILNMH